MELTPQELQRTRQIVLASDLPELARIMKLLQAGTAVSRTPAPIRAAAEELGWIESGSSKLTERGWFAADCCREYRFWIERDRQLPFSDSNLNLLPDTFAGKSVLEIGCGSGANLMSLSSVTQDLSGLEPIGIYRQIGTIFSEAERISGLRIVPGQAEAIPFPDARFDVVLCVTAHQYFDISAALQEIARVLKPGGQLIIIGGTFKSYVLGSARSALNGSLRNIRSYLVTIINTLGYTAIRRRVLVGSSKWSTAYPVYPSRRTMRRFISEAGLQLDGPEVPVGIETCFRARKAAGEAPYDSSA